jgi:hypothetical protein
MDQLERPQYYEGEYLSADDLAAIVRYARTAQARHALGAHTWGIALGLDLVERPLAGDDVEMVLTPGVAWDGYARPLVALAPQRLALDLFADLQDATTPTGMPVEVWLAYRELPASPPGVGFSCPDDDLHARIVESYRIEVRASPVADYHTVTVANRPVEATKAVSTFDASRKPLFDESVPSQTFPDTDRQRWPIFIGIVRWRKDAGQPGRLIKRIDADRNATRAARHYLGVVAETVFAADGVLRLRDRSNDPLDPVVNFKPPVVSAPPGTTPVNDLVWCEGHLRVVGDARLQGGQLDYRVTGGGDGGVPVVLRRRSAPGPPPKVTLDAFIGPPPPAPPNAESRFAVSTADPANPTERLTVVSAGRVGVNEPDPTNTLHVTGETGIRYASGYISGDQGAASAVMFNAFKVAGGSWVNPDVTHSAAGLVLGDTGGVPGLTFQTSGAVDPPVWKAHVSVKGDTGGVGIGTVAPLARLHVASDSHLNAIFDRTDVSEHLTLVVGNDGSGLRFSDTNEFFISSQPYGNRGDTTFGIEHLRIRSNGDTGIGTANPQTKLNVVGGRIRLGDDNKRIDLRTDGSAVDLHSETHDLYIRTFADPAHPGKRNVLINPSTQEGNVGVGTTAPVSKLHVHGDLRVDGWAYKTTPGSGWLLVSDRRLKKDIQPIENPLAGLLRLRGKSFVWRDPESVGAGPGPYVGFIAQDVEKVFPEWVATTPEGTKAVNPVGLEALLVEALRELTDRTKRLESEVAALRAQVGRASKTRKTAVSK